MFIAEDISGTRVHANEAKEKTNYYCPSCKGSVCLKNGRIKVRHFSHLKKCTDNWNYSDMSDWHIDWQTRYPIDCREVVVEKDDIVHRADILVDKKYVIEFQHSYITQEEFDDRNRFYTSCGYKVLWLFDVRDKYKSGKIEPGCFLGSGHKEYYWKHAPKNIQNIIPNENDKIVICLQLEDDIESVIQIVHANSYGDSIADYNYFHARRVPVDIISIEGLDDVFEYMLPIVEGKKKKKVVAIWQQEKYVEPIPHDIFFLWKQSSPIEVARFRNINRNYNVQIHKTQMNEYKKKGKLCGKICYDNKNYMNKIYPIYNADKNEWKIEWFVKSELR